jgi:hypothetical protein
MLVLARSSALGFLSALRSVCVLSVSGGEVISAKAHRKGAERAEV